MILPLACLNRYFLKVLQRLIEFVQHYQSLKSPPQWSLAKLSVPSIYIVVLDLLYIHVLCIVHTCIMRVSAVSSVRTDWQPRVHQKAEFPWDTYYQVKEGAILLSFQECLMLLLISKLHFFQVHISKWRRNISLKKFA